MRDEYDFSDAIQGKFYSGNHPKRITIMQLGSEYTPEGLIEMLNEDQRKELLEALQKVVKNAGNTRTSSKPTDE
jgi:hypothetical protein